MKSIITLILLLFMGIVSAQEPVLDSIQIFKALPAKPDLVVTLYNYDTFYENLTLVSDKLKLNEFIVVFFYKEHKDGPQHTKVKNFIRKVPK